MYTHVTPQWAGGLALELMLGTVGTGASECVRCVGVGAAGVGVGAASGAPRGGTRELLRGALSPDERGACKQMGGYDTLTFVSCIQRIALYKLNSVYLIQMKNLIDSYRSKKLKRVFFKTPMQRTVSRHAIAQRHGTS